LPDTRAVWPIPIDPQFVRDQDDMTWSDYRPIPGMDWTNPERKGTHKQVRLAVVTADFPDQPFVMTLPKQSDLFGNPQTDPIERHDVPKFFLDFYMVPNKHNHGRTIHEYWMEQSRGRAGVSTTVFGPYRMPGPTFEYGGLPAGELPAGHAPQARGLQRHVDSLWQLDKGANIARDFDLVLRLFAGYDETAVWQEFGEMKFQTRDDIPAEWGNPDTTKPRWVRSRYGAWTPWQVGKWLWSNAAIVQGESINTIRHELAHAAFGIGDNYNNPFAEPRRRAPAGPWDLMDRGSFNGPGGPHSRWIVPPNAGGSMSAGLMLRQRMLFGFVDSSQVLLLHRHELAKSGVAVARVMARAVDPAPGTVAGIHIRLDGDSGKRDLSPRDDPATNPLSSGVPDYDFYTVEVAQRIGYDSFVPDNGVLIAKNKDRARAVGGPNGFNTFTWTIDANPQDIRVADFTRPNGDVVMRSVADYRQLNDALFHAGTNSGSRAEWVDSANRLHFYVVDKQNDVRGILSYTLAVRSLDGAGPHRRGVALSAAAARPRSGEWMRVRLRNAGTAADVSSAHPTRDAASFAHDVYRLHVSANGRGWEVALQSEFVAVPFGESIDIPVFVRSAANASGGVTISVTATSESDPTQSVTLVEQSAGSRDSPRKMH
jgi:M6 family metalloprotease-like protein